MFGENIHPFERLGHPFDNTVQPFKRLGHSFAFNIHPFERLEKSVEHGRFFSCSFLGLFATDYTTCESQAAIFILPEFSCILYVTKDCIFKATGISKHLDFQNSLQKLSFEDSGSIQCIRPYAVEVFIHSYQTSNLLTGVHDCMKRIQFLRSPKRHRRITFIGELFAKGKNNFFSTYIRYRCQAPM